MFFYDYFNPPPIILKPHNPAWAAEFPIYKEQLEKILTGLPIVCIEHIGSTAIPHLIAKPVIDIAIEAPASACHDIRERLENHDYTYVRCKGRAAFWQPGTRGNSGYPLDFPRERRRNTYVIHTGSLMLKNNRDLIRVLMEDDGLRREYEAVKKYLVEVKCIEHVDEYCRGKNEIVAKILRKAGWTDAEITEVEKDGPPMLSLWFNLSSEVSGCLLQPGFDLWCFNAVI